MARTKDKITFEDKKKKAYTFFVSKGYTPQQSAGIVANLIAESSLDTKIEGDRGTAVGLAQWRLERRENLEKMYGDQWHSFENQLEFVDWELKNTEVGAYKALQNATTASEAALIFSDEYERPHEDWARNTERQATASKIANQYAGIPLENLTSFENTKENSTFVGAQGPAQNYKFGTEKNQPEVVTPEVDIEFNKPASIPDVGVAVEKEEENKKEDKISAAQQRINERMAERNLLINFLKHNQYQAPEYRRTNAFATAPPQQIMQKGGEVRLDKSYSIKEFVEDAYQAWFNPKNYGVKDYTSHKLKADGGKEEIVNLSFNEAYQMAKEQKNSEFIWKNKRYATDIPKSNFINKYIADNVYPYGNFFTNEGDFKIDYEDLMKAMYYDKNGTYNPENALNFKRKDLAKVAKNSKGVTYEEFSKNRNGSSNWGGPKDLDASYDALAIHQNQPQKYNSFRESSYKPSNSKNYNNKYYSFNDKYEKQLEDDLLLYSNRDFIESEEKKRQTRSTIAGASLKNYQYSKGKDKRGQYVAYYDKNDYGNILDIVPNANPFEIYGRIYYKDYGDGKNKRMFYTDKELSEIDVNKKNFDILALQRELSNRGYKLPKSTKEDGTFDGIWGDETKNALLEYRKSQNKLGQ